MTMLSTGDQAPDFTLFSDENVAVSLRQFRGKKVILYFYPKDHTPGCTRESCDFRDALSEFTKHNAIVLGISKDSVSSHIKFKAKQNLSFPLLSDEEGKVCEAYGVFKNKSMFGKTFLAIERTTVLIDEQGVIQTIWRKVKVPGHVKEVMEKL